MKPEIFERSVQLDASVEEAFAFHADPSNISKIAPPGLKVIDLQKPDSLQVGASIHLVISQFGVRQRWEVVWDEVRPPAGSPQQACLTDRAVRSPFGSWRHEHIFEERGGGCLMTDRVTFTLPWEPWSRPFRFLGRWLLFGMFRQRHARTVLYFQKRPLQFARMDQKERTFEAPWSNAVTITTAITALVLMGAPILLLFVLPEKGGGMIVFQLLPLGILIVAALFAVNGYLIEPGMLLIKRPFWVTKVELNGLESVEFVPDAMGLWSLRIFGSGGAFGYIGWFRNSTLGMFRVWATDRHRTVVLKISGRTVVISPDKGERFVEVMKTVNPPLPTSRA